MKGVEGILPATGLLRRTAPDLIADVLREAICTGRFRDGEVLNQVELAQRFGVSRIPTREAMRQLSSEGLVQMQPHQQAVVTTISAPALAEIYEIRRLLEVHLLEKAFANVDDALLARLRDLCDRLDAEHDDVAWLLLTREFHDTLLRAADRPFAFADMVRYRRLGERYIYLTDVERSERRAESGDEHRTIVAALQRRDLEGAMRAMADHITAAGETLERARRLMKIPEAG